MEDFEVEPEEGGYYAPITSLVTATADADEGWGSQPYYINDVFQHYKQVLINDDFAELNPTQIIGLNGIDSDNNFENPISGAFLPTGPTDLPGFTREVKQVYIGEVRCKKFHDAFISFTGNGGGNEMVFTRADGFLKIADGQVQADNYKTPKTTISRKNIRKKKFVDFSFEWDGDWELTNHQQNMAIYEDDNRNSSEISGSLSTTLKDPTSSLSFTGTIGFKITFKSDDEIIRQINFNRDSFFALNRTNLEGEMRNGWPVRDRNANTSYTLMDRTFF